MKLESFFLSEFTVSAGKGLLNQVPSQLGLYLFTILTPTDLYRFLKIYNTDLSASFGLAVNHETLGKLLNISVLSVLVCKRGPA